MWKDLSIKWHKIFKNYKYRAEMWNGLRTANPWQKICSIPPNASSMTLRVGFVGDQRHSILSPEICSITCGGLFILITLSFPLGFRSFSLPIFISYNVFTADWQKSLLLSLLLWASLGYWREVDFCRRRIVAEYVWRDGAAIGQFVSILDTPAQVFSPLLLLLLL